GERMLKMDLQNYAGCGAMH
ncbi:hypothetical protein A2U01_0066833, partial [Trifolium medium]|nr:hypothetical protein [Trifolium medium]